MLCFRHRKYGMIWKQLFAATQKFCWTVADAVVFARKYFHLPDVLLQGVSSSHTSAAENLGSWKVMWVSHKQNIEQKAIFF